MLFAELTLIRVAAASLAYVAYFTNFVLLASFLGVGIGFVRGGRTHEPIRKAVWSLAALIGGLLVLQVHVERADGRSFEGVLGAPALPPWIVMPLLFAGVVGSITLIGEAVESLLRRMDALDAYRTDILGSLAGIVAFTACSFLNQPPLVWGMVAAAAAWLAVDPPVARARVLKPILALLGATALVSVAPAGTWSPYYRVTTSEPDARGAISVQVNGLPHQSMVSADRLAEEEAFYLDPYRHVAGAPGEVLIIGAGTGNDVAVALRQGATRVDAVEIDPVLYELGARMHPDRPYSDPRVQVTIDDGRAFLRRTDRRYDLILFALPDSLTVVTGQGALRLESYLFTEEALSLVRGRLRENGVFAMYNYYREDVFERFAATIQHVFGRPPCVDERSEALGPRRQAVLSVALGSGDACASGRPVDIGDETILATDDWPFPYLEQRRVPAFYLATLGAILAFSVVALRFLGGRLKGALAYSDLFLMGVAFLLLESKSVVGFALLFGTTWLVNAMVFAGILASVWAAVELTRRRRVVGHGALHLSLGAALALAFLVPQEWLLALPAAPRLVLAVMLAFLPVFLANLLFASRLEQESATSTTALGVNLLGAMVGGVLEYAALMTGYRTLLILVALVYATAAVFTRKRVAAFG